MTTEFRTFRIVAVVVAAAVLSACAGGPSGGRRVDGAVECPSVSAFVDGTPVGQSRKAVFYWPIEPMSINMFAQLFADPEDTVASDFHAAHARSTHYFSLSDIAENLQNCLQHGAATPDGFHLIRGRKVRISATEGRCTALPADRAAEPGCLVIEVQQGTTGS